MQAQVQVLAAARYQAGTAAELALVSSTHYSPAEVLGSIYLVGTKVLRHLQVVLGSSSVANQRENDSGPLLASGGGANPANPVHC